MRKSNKYELGLVLFFTIVVFPMAKVAVATEGGSPLASVKNEVHASDEIPSGFKLERYASVWEHNPFTLVAPTLTPVQSPFDKLFLTSWLKDGRTDVVFIQSSETNEVRKITAQPDQDNLRLLALHLNSDPKLVEALIADGKEQGLVKFRFDAQSSSGQTVTTVAQKTNPSAPAGVNPGQVTSTTLAQPPVNPQNNQTSGLSDDHSRGRRPGSGASRFQKQGRQTPGPRGESEGLHLPSPGQTSG